MTSRKNDIVRVRIKDLAYDGKSVGDIDGKIIFLNAGLPGEMVEAKIIRTRPKFDVGRVLNIFEKSDERIPARCNHFGLCGGCIWQDLDYQQQLFYKQKQIIDCLEHIGRLDNIDVAPILGAPEQFHYRNKMEFSFNTDPDNGFVLGLHKRGKFDEIFDLKECHLTSRKMIDIVNWFRRFVEKNNIPAYDITGHRGLLRFLMIREAFNTGQILVNIVTNDGTIPNLPGLIDDIGKMFPEVVTIVQNINCQKSNIAKGEKEIVHTGSGFIEEKIFDHRYLIYSNSFFQTNSRQAETLYRMVMELLQPTREDRLLDLYCGTGTIGLAASASVDEVIGIELEPAAIDAAKKNADINNVRNAAFYAGSVQDILRQNSAILDGITCIITDPPRAGMHKKAMKKIVESACPRVVYVSCNPSTFARDAAILTGSGYKLGKVIPVDMFPHTMHIELVSIFKK